MIDERSAVWGLIFPTSRLKIAFRNELAGLGMEALKLTLAAGRGTATAGPECSRRVIQQLLLTGINFVRVNFIALRPVRRDQLVCQLIPDCGDTDSSAAPFALPRRS